MPDTTPSVILPDQVFKRAAEILGLPAPDSSAGSGPLEFVLDGTWTFELHGRQSRLYLVLVLSEGVEVDLGSPIPARLIAEERPGQTGDCILCYEPENQRLLVWREVSPDKRTLEESLREAIAALQGYQERTRQYFVRNHFAQGFIR